MTHIAKIRRSGGAKIVSIPTAILNNLNIGVDSKVEISVENSAIIIKPCLHDNPSLEELLAESTRESFRITEEDQEWLDADMQGED